MSEASSRVFEFENAFVSTSLCCPSRASYLTGDYPHNHHLRDNGTGRLEPNGVPGGFEAFRDGAEDRNIGIHMQRTGYETFFGGKYFNNYGREGTGSHVPSGWDSWHGRWPGADGTGPNSSGWNDDGRVSSLEEQGEDEDTMPDEVLGRKASSSVCETGKPFFAVLSTLAPHRDGGVRYGAAYQIDPEARKLYANDHAPRSPAFDEPDVSDKSSWIRQQKPLSEERKQEIDAQ